MFRKLCGLFFLCFVLLIAYGSVNATTLDFEDLTDLVSVGDFYASEGVHFTEAISLTAGFSLNEFDFPPSSGVMAIGDDWGPMEITFDEDAENIFANFTYAVGLTLSAYDVNDALLGTVSSLFSDNYGSTEVISLGLSNVRRLVIEGDQSGNSFIMDDFNFELNSAPVPEPSTILLFGIGILGVCGMSRKNKVLGE